MTGFSNRGSGLRTSVPAALWQFGSRERPDAVRESISIRALIIADIHSNLEALEAVLAAAPPHDVIWNLGDVVGYGACPNEVIDAVQRLGPYVLCGNHDRACSGLADTDDFSDDASRAVQWTKGVLTGEHREWLQLLPAGPISPDTPDVSCVHGSPVDEDEYLLTQEDAYPSPQTTTVRIAFFGHTHKQRGFATNGEKLFELRACLRSWGEICRGSQQGDHRPVFGALIVEDGSKKILSK